MLDDDISRQLHQAMSEFIAERCKTKLHQKKLDKIDEKDQEKQEKQEARRNIEHDHEPAVWIVDAANRADKIQIVTHALKFTHPDARGTSLYSQGNNKAGDALIGTHSLRGEITPDVVGNAAVLDVANFLSLEINDKQLWQRAVEQDETLLAAFQGLLVPLSESEPQAKDLMHKFAAVVRHNGVISTHTLAKQIYWPVVKGTYHLLQPLCATSLVHRVWEIVFKDRYSEESKNARKARYQGIPHPQGYREWPNLVIKKHGGTKPQNISQLNAKRHGEVYLLPSVPPQWQSRDINPPLKVKSVYARFGKLEQTREQIKTLKDFLVKAKGWNNVRIRQGRARRVEGIIDSLLQYVAAIQQCTPGWSASPDCQLPEAQCLWLDPHRDDPEFQKSRNERAWHQHAAEAFGDWLNEQVRGKQLPMGEVEFHVWRNEFEEALAETLKEMAL